MRCWPASCYRWLLHEARSCVPMPHFSQALDLLQPSAMIVPVVACQVWTAWSGMDPAGTAFCGQAASASSSPGLSSVRFPQAICLSLHLLHFSPGLSSCPVRASGFFLLSDCSTDLLLLFLVHTSYLLPFPSENGGSPSLWSPVGASELSCQKEVY